MPDQHQPPPAYGYDQRFEVLGSQGLLGCGNHRPTEVTRMGVHGVQTDNPENFFLQRYRDAYRLKVAHFFEQLQSGGKFRTTVHDGVAAQRLADAAAHSFETGMPVSFWRKEGLALWEARAVHGLHRSFDPAAAVPPWRLGHDTRRILDQEHG